MDMTVKESYGTTAQDYREYLSSKTTNRQTSPVRVSGGKKKKGKKKKLSYNAREIANQITQASRSVGAAQVLVRASEKLAQLQKCAVTGDYDQTEIRAAITHAKRMVKCARMKKNHLREEESMAQKKRKKTPESTREEQQIQQLLQRELSKLHRRHRGKEKRYIDEAQMRYLRQKANAARNEARNESMSAETGASDVSSGAEAAVPAADVAAAETVSIDVCL